MPTLMERRQAEYDAFTEELEAILERAATENRELDGDEVKRSGELDAARTAKQDEIEHEADMAERRAKVQARLSGIPTGPTLTRAHQDPPVAEDPDAVLLRDFPTPGDYVATIHRAWVKHDRDAVTRIERATAHQKLADNPGLVPRPIVAPLINRLRDMRPLISSIGVQAAPAPVFDRPIVTQHVDVDAQAAEKDLTVSQKMVIGKVPVTLATYAGHLNLSKQDVRWSQPSLLNVIYDDFGRIYARRTDKAACTAFVAAVTATQEIAGAPGTYTAAAIDAALGAVAATIGGTDGDNGELNHIWVSRDVAVQLAGMRNPTTSSKLYNIPLVNGTTGDLDGVPVTIDPRFAAATFIAGDDSLIDFWEDLEGFLTVEEPDVLGQLVGYAGYSALSVVDPTGFVKLTNIAALSASAGKK